MRKPDIPLAAALCAGCLAAGPTTSAEPAAVMASTAPAQAQQGPRPPAPKRGRAAPPQDDSLKQLKKALQDYLADSSRENDGLYAAEDPDSEETWMLELKRIGADKPRRVSKDEAILRAEFMRRGDLELGEKDVPILMDFTLSREDGRWTVTDEVVFSIGAKERFTYTSDNQRVQIVGPGAGKDLGLDEGLDEEPSHP